MQCAKQVTLTPVSMVHTYMNDMLTRVNYSMLTCYIEVDLRVHALQQRQAWLSPRVQQLAGQGIDNKLS